MKKILSLLIAMVMLVSCLGVASFAALPDTGVVEPMWSNTGTFTYSFHFDDATIGYAELSVGGKFGATRVTGTIEVYRQSGSDWIYVTGNCISVLDRTLTMSVPVTGVSGCYCKAVFTATVYKDGTSETITFTDYATCPSN